MGKSRPLPFESKGMVKVRNRDCVPGAASQRTRLESVKVAGEVGDDHFHDFVRDAAGRLVHGTRNTEEAIDLGVASMPMGHREGQEGYPYGANGAGVRAIHVHLYVAIRATENIEHPERPTSLVVWVIVVVVVGLSAERRPELVIGFDIYHGPFGYLCSRYTRKVRHCVRYH